MVLYRRVNERLLADARKEGRQEGHQEGRQEGREMTQKLWREWYASQPKEVRDQLSPPPEEGR